MARHKTAASTYQAVTVRFPKDILEYFRSVAAKEDRSLNEQLLHTLKTYLGNQKKGTHDTVNSRA